MSSSADPQAMEAEARAWVEALTGERLGDGSLVAHLRSGIVLCNVARVIAPELCPPPSESAKRFKQMENISNYLKACEALGVPSHDTFSTVDLFELKNAQAVLINLHSLGRVVQRRPDWDGPTLGARLSTSTRRSFSVETLQRARNAITFIGGGSASKAWLQRAEDRAERERERRAATDGFNPRAGSSIGAASRTSPPPPSPALKADAELVAAEAVATAGAPAVAAPAALGAPVAAPSHGTSTPLPRSRAVASAPTVAASYSAAAVVPTIAAARPAAAVATPTQAAYITAPTATAPAAGATAPAPGATAPAVGTAFTPAREDAGVGSLNGSNGGGGVIGASDAEVEARKAEMAFAAAEVQARAAEAKWARMRADAISRAGETAAEEAARAHGVDSKWTTHAKALRAVDVVKQVSGVIAGGLRTQDWRVGERRHGGAADGLTQRRPYSEQLLGGALHAMPTVINAGRYAALEAALIEAHATPKSSKVPFSSWPPSVALQTQSGPGLGQAAIPGAPSAPLELRVAYHGLVLPPSTERHVLRAVTSARPACQPIALLFHGRSPGTLLGVTEWRTRAAEQGEEFAFGGGGGGTADGHSSCGAQTGGRGSGTSGSSGSFNVLLGFDAAALPLGPKATLRMQIRHVTDAFWDARVRHDGQALLAMPLIGEATIVVAALLEAAVRGECVALTLLRPVLDADADPANAIGGTALVRAQRTVGFAPSHPAARHSVINYHWALQGSAPAIEPRGAISAAPFEATPTVDGSGSAVAAAPRQLGRLEDLQVLQRRQRQLEAAQTHKRGSSVRRADGLRACEHLLPCAYSLLVPLATLAMLLEDAELNAAIAGGDASAGGPSSRSGLSGGGNSNGNGRRGGALDSAAPLDEESILGMFDEAEWAQLARWLRQRHIALVDRANALVGGREAGRSGDAAGLAAEDVRRGLKPTRCQSEELSPMPTNLALSVFEVGANGEPAAVYPTVTLAAPAAPSEGFDRGGAEAIAAALASEIARGPWQRAQQGDGMPSPAITSARKLGRRCVLLKCQAYAALAASFALSCQEAAARVDSSFFRQLAELGYLVQFESLLTTRGVEWAMVQDTTVAVSLLSRVHLVVQPASGVDVDVSASRGQARPLQRPSPVTVKGGRLCPLLVFAPAELGLRDEEHAAQLGLPCGRMVRVHTVLATQGITDEQTLANVFHTNTGEQATINLRCVEQMAAYHDRRASLFSPPASALAAPRVVTREGDSSGAPHSSSPRLGDVPATTSTPQNTQRTGQSDQPSPRRQAGNAGADRALSQRVRVGTLLSRARALLRAPPDAKNVEFLRVVATLTRLLGGGRITMCSSGCDRATLSLTLEHGRLLQDHGLADDALTPAVQLMRRVGVRREIALRDCGWRLFGFNALQQHMLPEAYRPPEGTSRGL